MMNAFASDHMLELIKRLALRLPLQEQIRLVVHITERIGERLENGNPQPPYSEYILRLRRFLSESNTSTTLERRPANKRAASS